MARPRRLEFALARIAPHRHIRKRALRLAQRELERDMVTQMEMGVWYVTPAAARRWWYLRPDGVTVAIDEFHATSA